MLDLTDMLDSLEDLTIKIDTYIDSWPAKKFPSVRQNLNEFRSQLALYHSNIRTESYKLLPLVKGGQGGEVHLARITSNYSSSLFEKGKCGIFLANREREVKSLEILMHHIVLDPESNIILTEYKSANDINGIFKKPNIIIFEINIIDPKATKRYLQRKTSQEDNAWFNDRRHTLIISKLITTFQNFAKSNQDGKDHGYIIGINKLSNNSVRIYELLTGKDFQIPDTPKKLIAKDVDFDSVTFQGVNKPNNTWITKYIVKYWKLFGNLTETNKKQRTKYKEFLASDDDLVIDGLDVATPYQFTFRYYTKYGKSPESKPTSYFTRPTSPPTNLRMMIQEENEITLAWDKPVNMGKFKEYQLLYEASISDESRTIMKGIVKSREATFNNLKAYQQYIVEVVAHVNNTSSNPEQLKVFTTPPSPTAVSIKNISLNTVTLQWVKPKILHLTTGIEYIVKYSMMDTIGKHAIGGTEKTVTGITQRITEIQALAEGTYYQFQVKVVTSKGSSGFSSITTAKTNFKQTQLDKLKENINVQLIKPGIAKLENSIMILQKNFGYQ